VSIIRHSHRSPANLTSGHFQSHSIYCTAPLNHPTVPISTQAAPLCASSHSFFFSNILLLPLYCQPLLLLFFSSTYYRTSSFSPVLFVTIICLFPFLWELIVFLFSRSRVCFFTTNSSQSYAVSLQITLLQPDWSTSCGTRQPSSKLINYGAVLS
jgi:hypothetical protein